MTNCAGVAVAGCYWGTEKFTKHDFGRKVFTSSTPIVGGKVGFMAPAEANAKANPTYEEVRVADASNVNSDAVQRAADIDLHHLELTSSKSCYYTL